ncbi:MAG: S41 family peptidase [Candidatus Pacebacteria bacterium]|nr:S41 family peptidase [Candidatus Paceibacterota bacterium]
MKHSLSRSLLTTMIIVGIVGSFGAGMLVNKYLLENGGADSSDSQVSLDMDPFWKAYSILNEKFISTTASSTTPTDKEKVYGAIAGLASSYNDPYTSFFPPAEAEQFNEEVRGNFGGVGMEIGMKDKVLTVIAPLKGTPAERAGIKSGDIILKINDKFTAGMSVDDAIDLIRGPAGSTVTVTVKNGDSTKDIKIVRGTINIPTIETKLRSDGVFVISLYSFSANSPELFRGALREFVLSGSDKLILDLRNNPGGYLESAVDIASWFLPADKPIVIEDSGTKEPQKIDRSKGYNIFTDKLKMVILINGGSASAAEILAGALNEYGIAKLVGEKSFGKGSVQELVGITSDTSLKVTIARWLTPKGKSISHNGLEPDIKVVVSSEDTKKGVDVQMEKASEYLKNLN